MSHSQFFSQSQFQAEDPTWASIPLVKFSHTTQVSTRPGPWTHLDKDLKLEIQTFRVVDEQGILGRKVIMKVFANDTLLESQDLGQLVRISRSDGSMVVIVENTPRIAMRYQKDRDTVRKCEMKFSNDADFSIIINAMKDLELPVKPHVPRVPVLPSPVPSNMNSSSPALPAGFPQESNSRPSSAASGLVKVPPSTTFNVTGRSADIERPPTAESLRQATEYQPVLGVLDARLRSIPLPIQSQSRASSFYGPAKPSYMLQLERDSQTRQPSAPISQTMPEELNYGFTSSQARSSTFLHQLHMQQSIDDERSISRPRLPFKSPFFPPSQKTAEVSHRLPDPFFTSEPSGNGTLANINIMSAPPRRKLPFERPASTPAESQDLMIPPRQNLSFSRPESKPRSSSLLDLPPLPKPTPVAETNVKKTTDITTIPGSIKAAPVKRVAQRKAPIPEAQQETTSSNVSLKSLTDETTIIPPPTHEDEPSPLAAKSAAASRPASAAPGLASKVSAPSRKRVATPILPLSNTKRAKMVDQSTQTKTMVDQSTQTRATSDSERTKGKLPATARIQEVVPITPAVTCPPQSYLDDLEAFVATHRSHPAPVELWEMPGYAEADEDTRHAMLNDFIVQNLEDPNFLQLCEDMGNAWRRIGLGR